MPMRVDDLGRVVGDDAVRDCARPATAPACSWRHWSRSMRYLPSPFFSSPTFARSSSSALLRIGSPDSRSLLVHITSTSGFRPSPSNGVPSSRRSCHDERYTVTPLLSSHGLGLPLLPNVGCPTTVQSFACCSIITNDSLLLIT